MLSVSDRFELLLDAYRMPDGSKWTGRKLEDATDGIVTRAYVSSLRKDHVSRPSYDKLYAISRAMGFPVELWSEEAFNRMFSSKSKSASSDVKSEPAPKVQTAERTERLFQAIHNPRTGKEYMNCEVAELSKGLLSEERVTQIRNGEITSPTIDDVISLADVFGVSPSYFTEKTVPLINQETLEGLSKEIPSKIINKTLSLPESQQIFVLHMVENIYMLRSSSQLPEQ